MKLLALDSTTDACSAALYLDGAICERFEVAPRRHTALLLPMAHQLLMDAGVCLAELDYLAFTQGPGSFTGLRIAVGAVQGLALGLDRPVIGISTLAALAARAQRQHGASRVAVAMDARMGQVYWGQYELDDAGDLIRQVPDQLMKPGQVQPLPPGEWQAVGAGWLRYKDVLEAASGLRIGSMTVEQYPHAEDIARLAVERARLGEGVAAPLAQPVYLREQVAEKPGAGMPTRHD
jgi:tRNA threonylcarbamoyladenosine biosynthesis protein TsaB